MKETSIIELAGHRIALCGGDSVYQNFWSGYLATQSDAEPELTISYSDKQVNGIPVGSGATSRYFLIHKAISDFLLTKNVLTVHGSSLLFEGKAYLFCAPSGTGKSTHTGLWRTAFGEKVVMISDDQPLVAFDDQGGVLCCGSPYNGKDKLGSNIKAPIGGICVCERGNTNRIERLSPADAVQQLAPNVYIPAETELAAKALLLTKKLAQQLPVYRFHFNMDPYSAIYAMEHLTKSE